MDSIPASERIIVPRGVSRTPMMGHYGDMTRVGLAKDGQMTVEFGLAPERPESGRTPSEVEARC